MTQKLLPTGSYPLPARAIQRSSARANAALRPTPTISWKPISLHSGPPLAPRRKFRAAPKYPTCRLIRSPGPDSTGKRAQSARRCDFGPLGEPVGTGLVVVDERPCEERRSSEARSVGKEG